MESLPTYVKYLADGFTVSRATAVQRTEMESGPVKQLKTKSRVMVTRQVNLLFTSAADYRAFVAWFQDSINFGADWFSWLDPVDKTIKQARIAGGLKSETPIGTALAMWQISTAFETWGDA